MATGRVALAAMQGNVQTATDHTGSFLLAVCEKGSSASLLVKQLVAGMESC